MLVFASFRIGALFLAMPFFSEVKTPGLVTVILPVSLAAIIAMTLPVQGLSMLAAGAVPLAIAIANEIIIGVTMGFAVRILFTLGAIAGEIAGVQMGFSMAGLFDPSLGQIPLLAILQNSLMVIIFFAFNVHHALVIALVQSYQAIPPGAGGYDAAGAAMGLIKLFGMIYMLALRFALPVIATILMLHIIMGVISITAPEMNIYFNAAMNVNLVLGLMIVMLSFGTLMQFFQTSILTMGDFLNGAFVPVR